MDQQVKDAWRKIKEFWKKQDQKMKKWILVGAITVLVISIVVPMMLSVTSTMNTTPLYRGLATNETTEIFAKLKEMNINAQIDGNGDLVVPTKEVNYVKMQLSTLGYPKTGLSYDVFTNNSGFMATELEKKQYLVIDLQNRLAETIRQIEAVQSAIVTINLPESSNYVWDVNNKQGSASVLLTFKSGNKLSPELVSGIQNLVSSSLPQMEAKSVQVIDAATGTQLKSETKEPSGMDDNFLQIEFESNVEQKMQEKILNLLSLPYGLENIRVSASVVIDYDKMLSEELNYTPQADGKGVISSLEEWFSNNKDGVSSAPAGEGSNTEIPIYPEQNQETIEIDDYEIKAEYLVGYLKTQIEKNNAVLKSASVSVVVNNVEFSGQEEQNWINTIAKAINVNPSDVVVMAIPKKDTPLPPPTIDFTRYLPVIFIVSGTLGLLLLVLIISFLFGRKKRKKVEKPEGDRRVKLDRRSAQAVIQSNIIEKQSIIEKKAENSDPAVATLESIQDFAQKHPDMAATLIREMLREE